MDLINHLKVECQSATPPLDLHQRLNRVRLSAENIWQQPRLTWFTNHQAQLHSQNIIRHLGELLAPLQASPQKLNPHELFILLSACFLHDIGMQNFRLQNGKAVDSYDGEDYEQIRKLHPKVGKEMIIQRSLNSGRGEFNVDLDDNEYLLPIALVSQGHGTAYYAESVNELKEWNGQVSGATIRGPLLTSLLLIGDELDLHADRATFPPEFELSPMSLLHHLVHKFVVSVKISDGVTPKSRKIQLKLDFPEDGSAYRADVVAWISAKLTRQINLINPVLLTGSGGEMQVDPQIEVECGLDRYKIRRSFFESPSTEQALKILQKDLAKSRVVDRYPISDAIKKKSALSREEFACITIVDNDTSDWPVLSKHIRAELKAQAFSLVHVSFRDHQTHGIRDILNRIYAALLKLGMGKQKVVEKSDEEYLQSILTMIGTWSDSHPTAILLERIDQAEQATLRWLIQQFLPRLQAINPKVLLLVSTSDISLIPEDIQALKWFVLQNFEEQDIFDFLFTKCGYNAAPAKEKAAILYNTSLNGIPAGVLAGIESMTA